MGELFVNPGLQLSNRPVPVVFWVNKNTLVADKGIASKHMVDCIFLADVEWFYMVRTGWIKCPYELDCGWLLTMPGV